MVLNELIFSLASLIIVLRNQGGVYELDKLLRVHHRLQFKTEGIYKINEKS